MIPGQFEYVRPGDSGRGTADPQGSRGGGEAPVGRVQPDPADQAPARPAGPARRPQGRDRPGRHQRVRRPAPDRRPGHPPTDPRAPGHRRALPDARRSDRRHRRSAGPQLGHDRRIHRPRRPGQSTGRPSSWRSTPRSSAAARRESVRSRPATSSSTPSRRRSSRPRSSPRSACRRRPKRAGAAYTKLERKVGDFATCGSAVVVRLDADGRIGWAGVALTGVAETPFAATDAEAILIGSAPSEDLFRRRARPPGPRRDPRVTSAVPSNTSGRWPPR